MTLLQPLSFFPGSELHVASRMLTYQIGVVVLLHARELTPQ